jgi:hypothetical protein
MVRRGKSIVSRYDRRKFRPRRPRTERPALFIAAEPDDAAGLRKVQTGAGVRRRQDRFC